MSSTASGGRRGIHRQKQKISKSIKHSKSSSRGKLIWIKAYLKTQEKSQVNNLTYQLKKLEKELHIMSKIEESGSDIDKRENLKIRHQKTNRTSQ